MEALGDPVLSERAADIRQVGRRVVAVMRAPTSPTSPNGSNDAASRTGPVIVVAEELGPADMLGVQAGHVAAGVAVRGGANSHAAIVARTMGIPLVLGIDPAILEVADGADVVVDGDDGSVTVAPSAERLTAIRNVMDLEAERRRALAAERDLPAETLDGRRVGLLCNVATEAETVAGLEAGAEGVGLLRTELTFLDALEWPREEDHRRVLAPILARLTGRIAVVRVLDFGGDKVPPFLRDELRGRAGPHLRGLPALLQTHDALGAQLRATLLAGPECRLGILVPMVTSLREVLLAQQILQRAVAETGARMPHVGVMIEVPSAALLVDRIARDVDFLSVGTNDLTEHALGVDRQDPDALPALAAHPSVMTLINRVARAGRARGCAVRVCGEAAADPLVVPLLVGAGVDSLSVSPARIDEVRARIRRLSYSACSDALRDAMAADSLEDVWDLVRTRCWPELP
jgi:phosphoenolpyruvate-protein kinase (PTS system EI component)